MKIRRLRFTLSTLLLLPAMFALGWWMRGRNYERDVYRAADQIALETGGIFIPEIGLFKGDRRLTQRFNRMSPEAQAELQRRIDYLDETSQYYDDSMIPEQPSLLSTVMSFFFSETNTPQSLDGDQTEPATAIGTLDSLTDDGSHPSASDDPAAQIRRAAFFEHMRQAGER